MIDSTGVWFCDTFKVEDGLFHDFDDEYTAKANNIIEKLATKYPVLGIGRNRIVFKMKKYVLKFPLNNDGITDNDWETSISNGPNQKPDEDIQYPKTRFITYKEFPCCIMEYVEYVKYNKNMPYWVDYVDCQQVGYTQKGRLVAFDYGLR